MRQTILFTVMLIILSLAVNALNWPNYGYNFLNSNKAGTSFIGGTYSLNTTIASVTTAWHQPLIYDLDGNGNKEILTTYSNTINIYDSAGNFITGNTIPNLNGHQASTSIGSSLCGGIKPAIIVETSNGGVNTTESQLMVYCFNGTSLNYQKNMTIPQDGYYRNQYARCDVDGTDNCYWYDYNSSAVTFWHCPIDGINTTSCIEDNPEATGYSLAVANENLFPADNTQGGSTTYWYAWAAAADGKYVEVYSNESYDLGRYVGTYYNSYPTYWFPVLIERSATSDYIAFKGYSDAALHKETINVWDTALAGKSYKFTMSLNDTWGHISDYVLVSNPVIRYDDDICAVFKSATTSVWPGSCQYQINCYALTGIKTAQGDVIADGSHLCGGGGADTQPEPLLTIADITNDGIEEYFFNGLIVDGSDFSIIDDTTIGYKPGWYLPVDLNNGLITDLVSTDASGNLYIYKSGLSNPGTCADTDNSTYPTINYNSQGTMSFLGSNFTDYCNDLYNLHEYYCINGVSSLEENYNCSMGCLDGRCLTCLESWTCTPWTSCSSGMQTRSCSDLNGCGTTLFQPDETVACSNSNNMTMSLPATLIDSSNPFDFNADALLPQIFSGILRFASYTLYPLMIIIFFIALLAAAMVINSKTRG